MRRKTRVGQAKIEMNNAGLKLYYLTAVWLLLGVLIGGYFLLSSAAPTADVVAESKPNIMHVHVGDFEPGDASILRINGKPIVVWRRSNEEMAKALTQFSPELAFDQVLKELNDGTLKQHVGSEEFTYLEWLILSAVDVGGIGCIVAAKAGDFGGFFDPCRESHFDMWGRAAKGASNQNLKVVPSRFDEERQSVLLDVTDMPKTR